jgi:hypothetical protein
MGNFAAALLCAALRESLLRRNVTEEEKKNWTEVWKGGTLEFRSGGGEGSEGIWK